ncbi:MAG: 4Fe-4S dicluster domain-containing protein [Desulfomonilaceae bacterium]|nr:4Fe-4S dicluster domain-containing protein [Desulfomonilaceae bacterium]
MAPLKQVVSSEGLFDMLREAMKELPVIAPAERKDQPGFHHFARLQQAEDFVPDYVTTTLPPKKAFFQPSETLFTFTTDQPPALELVSDTEHFVLAGVHPCDLAGLDALDLAYSQPPAEVRWPADRGLATVVGIDCMPDDYCFCSSVGTCLTRQGCDLFLTKVDRGYLAEVYTPAGDTMLAKVRTWEPTEADIRDAEQWRERKVERMTAHLEADPAEIADLLEAGGLAHLWKETAERCYSCGSCNTTCPACFCFDMHDEFDLSLKTGIRRRTWDSCQLLEFALVAGRHNFRQEREQRVRHRWHRKFLYLYRRLGRAYCTGCGRCSRACTADINLVDVTNALIAHARKAADHA